MLNQNGSNQDGSLDHLVGSLGDLLQPEVDILRKYAHLVDCLFINADGIYLATYSALLLTMKLIYLGYYTQLEGQKVKEKNSSTEDRFSESNFQTYKTTEQTVVLPLTETQFIDEIFNYNTTIYLSPHFLAEIYQHVLVENFFFFLMVKTETEEVVSSSATSMTVSFERIPLIKLLHGKFLSF